MGTVRVTASAMGEFRRLRENLALEPGQHLRLATPPTWIGEGDFGIVIDEERPGDHAEEVDGEKVLLVGEEVTEHLGEAVLDFKETPEGTRFTLDVYPAS